MPSFSMLTDVLRKPLRAIEETVVTIVLVASVALPVFHFIPTGSGNDAAAADVEDLHCASTLAEGHCTIAQDALVWAAEVSAWKFPDSDTDQHLIGAFGQCVWTGAVAQRIGADQATVLATAHHKSLRQSDDELQMAVANISVGAAVGEQSNLDGGTDTWGWIIDECESRATGDDLHGPGGIAGRY